MAYAFHGAVPVPTLPLISMINRMIVVQYDNWQPELSRIPGVRRYHEDFGREICPNANTLEDSLDQYDSMVKEKTLADLCKDDPRWLQILPSTELAP